MRQAAALVAFYWERLDIDTAFEQMLYECAYGDIAGKREGTGRMLSAYKWVEKVFVPRLIAEMNRMHPGRLGRMSPFAKEVATDRLMNGPYQNIEEAVERDAVDWSDRRSRRCTCRRR